MADLTGRCVLVTGGAGFVGSHVVDAALAAGAKRVIVVDDMSTGRIGNLAAALAQRRVELMCADVRDADLVNSLVAEADVVLHTAALSPRACGGAPGAAMQTMVTAMYDLVRASVEHRVGKLVFASCASVYGLPGRSRPGEGALHGAAKLFGEGLLRSAHETHGLDYVVLRPFEVYGPRMDAGDGLAATMVRWMAAIERGLPLAVVGDGRAAVDLVHAADVARAVLLAATLRATDRVYDVAHGETTALATLATALARAMGRPDLAPVPPAPCVAAAALRGAADTAAAARDLGFEARIGLAEGLADLATWWRARPHPAAAPVTAAAEAAL